MIEHVFVYGTLLPGESRAPLLRPMVVDGGEADTAEGQIFDTRRGYPAARFDLEGTIQGRSYLLRAERIERSLAELDEIEGTVSGLYHRIEITTGLGRRAWAYQVGEPVDEFEVLNGSWLRR